MLDDTMNVIHYISENWGLLVLLAGFFLVLVTDVHLERKMIRRILLIVAMLFVYSVTSYAETFFGNQTHYSIARAVLSAVNYSLVSLILANTTLVLFPAQKRWLYVPALLNIVLSFVSIPTGVVFYFSPENVFGRGPLGFLPYITSGFYLLYLTFQLFLRRKSRREDRILLGYITLTSVACLAVPLFLDNANSNWYYLTITVNLVLYYLFLLQQFTKRDPLTGLLNRQSYYADAEKHAGAITAVVAIDMNGLKQINDTKGHAAGDAALKTLADCLWQATSRSQRLYRIGGDEYVALCQNSREEDVRALIENIQTEVAKTPYTCAVGYAMRADGLSVEKAYQLADRMLYEEKKKYYLSSGKERRKQ